MIQSIIPTASKLTKVVPVTDYVPEFNSSAIVYNRFGDYENNVLDFSIFNESGELIHREIQFPTGKHVSVSRNYFDVENKKINYTFDRFSGNIISEFISNVSQTLTFPISQDLNRNGSKNGVFTVGYQPITLIVGSDSKKLKIKEISDSGKELKIICDRQDILDDFKQFSDGKVRTKYVISTIISILREFSIYNNFQNTVGSTGISQAKINYAFSFDIDILFFLYDVLNGYSVGKNKSNGTIATDDMVGAIYLIENLLYSQYEQATTTDEILKKCISICEEVVFRALSRTSYSGNIEYFYEIFKNYLNDVFALVNKADNFVSFSPLKTYIALSSGEVIPILNRYHSVENGVDVLVVKIDKKETSLLVGAEVYITRVTFNGVLQKVFCYSTNAIETKKLKSANFSLNKTINYSENNFQSDPDDVGDYSGVNYRYFENFIKFSSASSRLDIYKQKTDALNALQSELLLLIEGEEEYLKIIDEISLINLSFDGYESFLKNNPDWLETHSGQTNGILTSVVYDRYNKDSLVNSTPTTIVQSEENSDYVIFLNMIGHLFDNIDSKISCFPSNLPIKNTEDVTVSTSILHQLLESHGRELSDSVMIRDKNYTRILWNRFFVEHPFILKEKGTKKSIESIISCYGIPDDIITIREYSTNVDVDLRTSVRSKIMFSPEFRGTNEYVSVPSVESPRTIQFKFSCEVAPSAQGTVTRLVQCDDKWSMGIIKRTGINGSPFFTIRNNINEVKTLLLDDLPIFDDSIYNVIIRKKEDEVSSLSVPKELQLTLNRVSYNEITHTSTGSIFVSGSYLDSFFSGSNTLFFGNYNTSEPEMLVGTLDDIKIWKYKLSDKEIFDQSLSIGNYSTEYVSEATRSLIFSSNFEYPIDLYSTSSNIVSVRNKCPATQSISHCEYNNFRTGSIRYFLDSCGNVSGSNSYPYQFKRFLGYETVNVPNLATENVNSTRVRKLNVDAPSVLSPSKSSVEIYDGTIALKKLGILLTNNKSDEYALKLISGKDFSSIFGNPSYLNSKIYTELEAFKRNYLKYLPKRVNFNVYTNHVKNYIDPSIFSDIKDVVPASSNLISGIMVENGILEKNKYPSKPIKISQENNIKQDIRIRPSIYSNATGTYHAVVFPEFYGINIEPSSMCFRFETSDEQLSEVIGNYTNYAPQGGHYFKDGVDYYIDVLRNKKKFEHVDGTSIYRNYTRLNLIKFPDIYEVDFNGTLNGTFTGSYVDFGDGRCSVVGSFIGVISSGSSFISNTLLENINIVGTYVGLVPNPSTLITDYASFIGKFSLSEDFYNWAGKNVVGEISNEFKKAEKFVKYNAITKLNPLTSKNKRKIVRTSSSNYIKSLQTTSTTISDSNGLPDGSLPFTSNTVDRGRVVVSPQGNGNVLSS